MQCSDNPAQKPQAHSERTPTNQPGQRASVQDVSGQIEGSRCPGLQQPHNCVAHVVGVHELQCPPAAA
jgi:hypothetical protein